MKREFHRLLKHGAVLLLATVVVGTPSLASAHRDWDRDDKVIVVVPKHQPPRHRHAKPRVIREHHHYYEPYVIEHYVRPPVREYYYYDYAPRYPNGNLNLNLDVPFKF
jgi:hypothetical protein